MPTTLATTTLQPRTVRPPASSAAPQPSWSNERSRFVCGEERRIVFEIGPRWRGRSIVSMPTTRPGRCDSTTTRSDRYTASGTEWVTNTTVVGSDSHRRASRWRMSSRVISSRAANGSSISSSGAPSAIARTRATRLLHPARQLVRVGVGEVGETDLGEQLAGRARRFARRVAVDLEEQAGVAGDGAPREQRRRLRHEADALGDAGGVRAAAVDLDDPGARLVETTDQAQQRRLAAARGAEDGDDLARERRRDRSAAALRAARRTW